MKQHITKNQLDELNKKGKRRYYKFLRKIKDSPGGMMYHDVIDGQLLPLLSIGQMIEFLGDDLAFVRFGDPIHLELGSGLGYGRKELCDALWEAVKEVLEKK